MPLTSRFKDLLLYIAIGVVVVSAVVAWAWFFPLVTLDHAWSLFAWFTAGTWFILVQSYWRARHSRTLWIVLGLAFLLHIALFAFILKRVQLLPGIFYLFSIPAELMAIAYVVWRVMDVLPQPARKNSR